VADVTRYFTVSCGVSICIRPFRQWLWAHSSSWPI